VSEITIIISISELLLFHYMKDDKNKDACNSIYILGH